MIDVDKLKKKISDKGMSISKLAEIMDIDRATLYRKMQNNGRNLSIKDAIAISKVLNLSTEEVATIFFNDIVA